MQTFAARRAISAAATARAANACDGAMSNASSSNARELFRGFAPVAAFLFVGNEVPPTTLQFAEPADQ